MLYGMMLLELVVLYFCVECVMGGDMFDFGFLVLFVFGGEGLLEGILVKKGSVLLFFYVVGLFEL